MRRLCVSEADPGGLFEIAFDRVLLSGMVLSRAGADEVVSGPFRVSMAGPPPGF